VVIVATDKVDERSAPHERLGKIAQTLRAGQTLDPISPRELLSWFGAYKRSFSVSRRVRNALRRAGLTSDPDFESAYMDAEMQLFLDHSDAIEDAPVEPPTIDKPAAISADAPVELLVSLGLADPTNRIGKLAAANSPPLSVAPTRPAADAVTLMLSKDFSQLPVMTNERTVKGIISWRSIGSRLALGLHGIHVSDFMEEAYEVSSERSLFSVIPTIVEHGYVLVRNPVSKVSGIVTTSDLSIQFQQLSEPFLLLGEIENQVRRLIDGRFTLKELTDARDPNNSNREIESVADLTFGEYIRLLGKPEHWTRVAPLIDRTLFLHQLDDVRSIRNEIMHFDPDPLPDLDLATLRSFVRFLQTLLRISSARQAAS
jgi:CBS domain-containing protein